MVFNFDKNFNLRIEIDDSEKLHLMSEFSKINNQQFEPMQKWFNDPNVPQSEKDKYSTCLTNALRSVNLVYNLLKACGISDQEILKYASLPF